MPQIAPRFNPATNFMNRGAVAVEINNQKIEALRPKSTSKPVCSIKRVACMRQRSANFDNSFNPLLVGTNNGNSHAWVIFINHLHFMRHTQTTTGGALKALSHNLSP
ncbi:hypothetical protein BGLA2_2290004 [Burkholderia gladioli]|nr:hypothetical protein BGLA2_2290004 [Burkholderia gladioli]